MRILTIRGLAVHSLLLVALACGGSTDDQPGTGGSGGSGTGGSAGAATGGFAGAATGGFAGASTGGVAGAGVGGSAGAGGCAELKAKYATALGTAKQCSLFPGTSDCSVLVDSVPECFDLPTFVDANNSAAVAELGQIGQQWDALGCPSMGCGGVGGSPPKSAKCSGGGQGGDVGICVDQH